MPCIINYTKNKIVKKIWYTFFVPYRTVKLLQLSPSCLQVISQEMEQVCASIFTFFVVAASLLICKKNYIFLALLHGWTSPHCDANGQCCSSKTKIWEMRPVTLVMGKMDTLYNSVRGVLFVFKVIWCTAFIMKVKTDQFTMAYYYVL